LFLITKANNPRIGVPKDVPNCSRNISECIVRDGVDEDDVNLMEDNDIDIIENGEINILIHDTFAPMDDDFNDIRDVLLIDKA